RSTLSDGRSAIAITVLQLLTRDEVPAGEARSSSIGEIRRGAGASEAGAGSPAADDGAREAALERAKEFMRRQSGRRASFFRDPELTSGTFAPEVRVKFLDPTAERPEWSVPGPTTVERSGPEDAPSYRVTNVTRSDDGRAKESDCRFRVEDGNLRSVAY